MSKEFPVNQVLRPGKAAQRSRDSNMQDSLTADQNCTGALAQLCTDSHLVSTITVPIRKRIKVAHIINSLGIGGAELALFRLVTNSDRSVFNTQIVSLVHEDPLGSRLRDSGFRVTCLNLSKKDVNASAVSKLTRLLRAEKPDVVQTWLQHSDLAGGMAARFARSRHVFWNIRHGTLHPIFTSRRTRLVTRVCAVMAHIIPDRIVCCSESSRTEQIKLGFPAKKMLVIPNGVDTVSFCPDSCKYGEVRRQLGISGDMLLFGAAGRLHAQKDYPNLIRATGQIARQEPDSHFAFCGEGITMENPSIRAMVIATGVPERFHLLGQQDNVPRFMAGLDVFISAARFGEGFPNVISEAMACGVPCVVTNIGDSALIVGGTGRVVPAEQPTVLAEAVLAFVEPGRDHMRKLGEAARRRVVDCFSLSRMVDTYQRLYSETVLGHTR